MLSKVPWYPCWLAMMGLVTWKCWHRPQWKHTHTHRKICSTKLIYKYNNSNNNNHNHNNNSNNNNHNHNNNNHNHNKKIIMMMIVIIFHLWIHGVTYMASHIQAHTIRVSVIILHVM